MNKRAAIIAGVFGVIVLIIIGSFLFRRNDPNLYTGGSGQAEVGTLILTGYDTPSNDSAKVPIGEFLSSDQQVAIRKRLEGLLYKKQPEEEYRGKIAPGSVAVNYTTNVIQFKVEVQKPSLTYTVNYNPVNDEMSVLDENNQPL